MTHYINSACACTMDRSCVSACPVDCILGDSEDVMLFIDPALCIDCGACVPVCPVKAIRHERDATPADVAFVDINSMYFTDKAGARAAVHEQLTASPAP